MQTQHPWRAERGIRKRGFVPEHITVPEAVVSQNLFRRPDAWKTQGG